MIIIKQAARCVSMKDNNNDDADNDREIRDLKYMHTVIYSGGEKFNACGEK